jgi:hypothetical protein
MLWEGRSSRAATVFLAEGPLEENVDQEITRKNADGDEYVERHDEIQDAFQDVGKS